MIFFSFVSRILVVNFCSQFSFPQTASLVLRLARFVLANRQPSFDGKRLGHADWLRSFRKEKLFADFKVDDCRYRCFFKKRKSFFSIFLKKIMGRWEENEKPFRYAGRFFDLDFFEIHLIFLKYILSYDRVIGDEKWGERWIENNILVLGILQKVECWR